MTRMWIAVRRNGGRVPGGPWDLGNLEFLGKSGAAAREALIETLAKVGAKLVESDEAGNPLRPAEIGKRAAEAKSTGLVERITAMSRDAYRMIDEADPRQGYRRAHRAMVGTAEEYGIEIPAQPPTVSKDAAAALLDVVAGEPEIMGALAAVVGRYAGETLGGKSGDAPTPAEAPAGDADAPTGEG